MTDDEMDRLIKNSEALLGALRTSINGTSDRLQKGGSAGLREETATLRRQIADLEERLEKVEQIRRADETESETFARWQTHLATHAPPALLQ